METGTGAPKENMATSLLEQHYGLLLEAIPDAMFLVDVEGTIQLVNTQVEQIFGYTRAEILGKPVEMVMPGSYRSRHREHVRRYATNPELRLMGQSREFSAKRKNGSEFHVEVALSPVEIEGIRFTFAAVRDITVRKTVQEAQRQLDAILGSSPDAITRKDLNCRITAWNAGAEQMFGYTEQDVLGKSNSLLIPADKWLIEQAAERTVLDHGEIQRFESVRQNKDGKRLDVAVTVSPIRDEHGAVIGLSDMAKSIAARKKAESELVELNLNLEQRIVQRSEALLASERRYHNTLDKMMEGVQIISSDWRYMYVNDALAIQSTLRKEELLGRTMMEVFPGIEHTALFTALQACMKDGTARNVDNDFTFPNGVSRSFQLSLQPMESGIFVLSTDITQRKLGELALRTSEARFHNALDVLIEGAQILGYDWQHIYVNDAMVALSTFTKAELMGSTLMERYPGVEDTAVFKEMQRCMVERCTHTMETEFTFPNGTVKSIYLRIHPADEGLFVLFQDITERRSAELELAAQRLQLKEQNRELEQFTYIASHDLQEPLRMVTNYVQLLERRYGERLDTDAHEFIAFAVDGAQRMKQLIDDLLTYSRVGRSAREQTVDMNAVVQKVLRNLEVAIAESGAKLHIGELPSLQASPTDMVQLMQNLIGNALKFGNADKVTEVWINGSVEATQWCFEVIDNGIGIEPEYSEKIFVPFKRLNDRTSYAGSGIGLAIAAKVVQGYGGKIWVTSVPGQGSNFQFTLQRKRI